MRTILKIIIFVAIVVPVSISEAQELNITRIELSENKMNIYYSLIDTTTNRQYTIYVYISSDNYLNPLEKVSGDVGIAVDPGNRKKIVWDIANEKGPEFEGKLSVEIRGRVYVPFVQLTGFKDYKVLKRGVPFVITWSGGSRQNVLNFDLYNDDTKVWTQPNVGNTGNFEMMIPASIKPGKNYSFRISDAKNKDEVVYTDEFRIKRKIPLGVKIIPIVAAGVAAYLLFQSDEDPRIPNPPCPDGSNDCN